jgi:hypothetical protein
MPATGSLGSGRHGKQASKRAKRSKHANREQAPRERVASRRAGNKRGAAADIGVPASDLESVKSEQCSEAPRVAASPSRLDCFQLVESASVGAFEIAPV